MKKNFFSKPLVLCSFALALMLASCQNLSSSSESSTPLSTTNPPVISDFSSAPVTTSQPSSSKPSSSTPSSSRVSSFSSVPSSSTVPSSSSLTLPLEGQTAQGVSASWPKNIIETIFSSPSRLTIPLFSSETSYIYQYTYLPKPWISITIDVGVGDGVTTYTNQLSTAAWQIIDQYRWINNFTFAADQNHELMISYTKIDNNLMIVISPYDQSFFDDFNVEESLAWPTSIIDQYIGNTSFERLPELSSNYSYYYIMPTNANDELALFTRLNEEANLTTYGSLLTINGWMLSMISGTPTYVDTTGKLSLTLYYDQGYAIIKLTNTEGNQTPPTLTSSTWPTAAINDYLFKSFLTLPIPSFNAPIYHYFTNDNDYGIYLSIYSEVSQGLMDSYVQSYTDLGYTVKPINSYVANGFFAIDPEFEIIIAIEYLTPNFGIKIQTYRSMLESYYETGLGNWVNTDYWPSSQIYSLLDDDPAVPVPGYAGGNYYYRYEYDDYGRYLNVRINADSSSEAVYTQNLVNAGYTARTQNRNGTLIRIAYDADLKVFLDYYFVEGTLHVVIRQYEEAIIGGDPLLPIADVYSWPSDVLELELGLEVAQLVPILESLYGYKLTYNLVDNVGYVSITSLAINLITFEDYLYFLQTHNFVVNFAAGLATADYYPYVAVDNENKVMMVIALDFTGVTLDIRPYHAATYESYVQATPLFNQGWPSALINTLFGAYFDEQVVPFASKNIFYTAPSLDSSDSFSWVKIQTQTANLGGVESYISILTNLGWTLESQHVNSQELDQYLLSDPMCTVILKVFYLEAEATKLQLWLTPYSSELFSRVYDEMFNPVLSPSWPIAEMMDLFNGASLPTYEFSSGEKLQYQVDLPNRSITMTIETSDPNAFRKYISTLDDNDYIINQNDNNHTALAHNSSGLINVFFSYADGVLYFEIRGVDYTFFDDKFTTYIRDSSLDFPTAAIASAFDTSFAYAIVPFVSSDDFLYYTQIFVSKVTLKISIANSSENEFASYYFSLMDNHWNLNGSLSSNAFTATDPISGAKVEVEYNTSSHAVTIEIKRTTTV